MKLEELKQLLRTEETEYKEAVERIKEEALVKKNRYVDFTLSEIPESTYDRLIEDGYKIHFNEHLTWCYRVYGWAGEVQSI